MLFYIPSGSLGKKLLMVSDVMKIGDNLAIVNMNKTVQETLLCMTQARIGIAIIINEQDKIKGVFTDGDLRRKLKDNNNLLSLSICEIMNQSFLSINSNQYVSNAISIMKKKQIGDMPVIDHNNQVLGVISIKDLSFFED